MIRKGESARWIAAVAALILGGGVWFGVGKGMPRKLTVCQVQGTGPVSPYLERVVIVRGLVSYLDPQGGIAALLDPSCSAEGEASRGILVSLGDSAALFQPGDELQITGLVQEVDGETRLQAAPGGLEILSLGNDLPDPPLLPTAASLPGGFSFESWEGQLVRVARAYVQDSLPASGGLLVLPDLPPDPALALVCYHQADISLRLTNPAGEVEAWENCQAGAVLEGLVGLLRQEDETYSLALLEAPDLVQGIQAALNPSSPFSTQTGSAGTQPAWEQTLLPSGTAASSPSPSAAPSQTVIPTPTHYAIHLLLSEFLPNPLGAEPAGEWIEIYNPAASSLPLDGIKLGDAVSPSGKEGMLRFPGGHRIGGQEVLVIAHRASSFTAAYGFRPDFELEDSDSLVPDLIPYAGWAGSQVQLSNSGDEVLLVDPWDRILDLVAFGTADAGGLFVPLPAPGEGHSLERYPPELDRDQAGDWRERSDPSPGWLDRSPPTPATAPSLTGTTAPSPSPTQTAETFEPSPTVPALSLTSSPTPSLPPASSSTPSVTAAETPGFSSTPSATAFSSLTSVPLPSQTLEFTSTLTSTSTWFPSATSSPTMIPSPGTGSPEPSGTPPSPTGLPVSPLASPTAAPSASVTSAATAVTSLPPSLTSTSFDPPSPAPTGTPGLTPGPTSTGTVPSTIPTAGTLTPTFQLPRLVINEIHADPDPVLGDSNGDGQVHSDDDEFLELVNVSGQPMDLGGWEVFDAVRLRYTFPAGTVLADGCGLVLFGGGDPQGEFGGSLVFTASSLGLNNSGDRIAILDGAGQEIASVEYGPEGGENQSLARFPDLVGDLPLVPHSLIPEAQGALYSPGLGVDLTPWAGCP